MAMYCQDDGIIMARSWDVRHVCPETAMEKTSYAKAISLLFFWQSTDQLESIYQTMIFMFFLKKTVMKNNFKFLFFP